MDSMGNVLGTGDIDMGLAENVRVNSWQFTESGWPFATVYYCCSDGNNWLKLAGTKNPYFEVNGLSRGAGSPAYCAPRPGADNIYSLSLTGDPWAVLAGPGVGSAVSGKVKCVWTCNLFLLVHATDDNEGATQYGATDPNVGRYTQRGTANWVMDISGEFNQGVYTTPLTLGSPTGITYFDSVTDPDETYTRPPVAFADVANKRGCQFKEQSAIR